MENGALAALLPLHLLQLGHLLGELPIEGPPLVRIGFTGKLPLIVLDVEPYDVLGFVHAYRVRFLAMDVLEWLASLTRWPDNFMTLARYDFAISGWFPLRSAFFRP
jgi:hypothetical protein